jgi:hypothetical protein
MDFIGLRLIFLVGLIAVAGLAIFAGPLISSLGARRRSHRDAPAGPKVSARWTVEEDDSRGRSLEFKQMLWRSLL